MRHPPPPSDQASTSTLLDIHSPSPNIHHLPPPRNTVKSYWNAYLFPIVLAWSPREVSPSTYRCQKISWLRNHRHRETSRLRSSLMVHLQEKKANHKLKILMLIGFSPIFFAFACFFSLRKGHKVSTIHLALPYFTAKMFDNSYTKEYLSSDSFLLFCRKFL